VDRAEAPTCAGFKVKYGERRAAIEKPSAATLKAIQPAGCLRRNSRLGPRWSSGLANFALKLRTSAQALRAPGYCSRLAWS